jgi:phenylacetate-coenzyme A ligase PaaK-like adenylate-forming protein
MHRWLIWNVLFRLHEQVKGHATYRFLRDMEAADRSSVEQLEALRTEKLCDLIRYAYDHVPYIQGRMLQANVKPNDIRRPSDLPLLPVMRKADARANRELMRSDIAGKLASFTTGGSTGDPLIFELGKRRVASRVACRQRTSRWWGVSTGDRELAIWGSPVELTRQDWLRGLRDRFLATRLLSAFEMNDSTMSQYLDILERGNVRQIFGYPSALYLLCMHAKKERRNLAHLRLQVAFVTGEVLFPYQRTTIAETLHCPVANGYGGRDSALIAHECPQGGMHVLADAVIVELIGSDGNAVPPGQPGEIVITDLYSHEAPFIRYATGDIAVWSSTACPCGRPLPLLERIEGRSNDVIVAPDGRIINSLALIYAVREIEGIERFRIVQRTTTSFHVDLVRNNRFSRDSEERIRKSWNQLLRSTITVTFEYMPELPVEPSGKFRHVVSQVRAS